MEGHRLAIEVSGIGKRFGSRTALTDVDLRVEPGRVVGLVGPNGAGKTTLIRVLARLARPSTGTARILGLAPGDPSLRGRVGFVFENPAFYPWLSAADNLSAFAAASKVRLTRAQSEELLTHAGLGERVSDRVGSFSMGMRQRLAVACSLTGGPAVLVWDEPGNGLDALGIVDLRRVIQAQASAGTAILFSSHQLGEVERICDSVVLLNRGRVALVSRFADLPVETRFRVDVDDVVRAQNALLRSGYHADIVQDALLVTGAPGGGEINGALMSFGVVARGIVPDQPSLEDVFLRVTELVEDDS